MEGQTEPNRGPIALDESREGLRREGASAPTRALSTAALASRSMARMSSAQ